MADVFNAIWIGFPFSQDFDFDVGAIPAAASLWLDLRKVAAPGTVLADHVTLQKISAVKFRLTLSAVQTAGFSEGAVEGDLIEQIGAANVPLNLRITIPVIRSASDPAP